MNESYQPSLPRSNDNCLICLNLNNSIQTRIYEVFGVEVCLAFALGLIHMFVTNG